MNNYLDAMERLWSILYTTLSASNVNTLRRIMLPLLSQNIYTHPNNSSNPIRVYGAPSDVTGNRSRLFAQVNTVLTESAQGAVDDAIRDAVEEMFEVHNTNAYNALTEVLNMYLALADTLREDYDGSDSGSGSDSS